MKFWSTIKKCMSLSSVYFQTLMSRGKQSVCVYIQAQARNPLSKQKQKLVVTALNDLLYP